MKRLAAALLAGVAAPALAGECQLSPPAVEAPGLSVVAPEMQRQSNAGLLCVSVGDALARIHATQSVPALGANGDYVKQTEFDNSPWRFDMSQDGRRMTVEEFEAWMKAKGIHVAKGRAVPAETLPPSPPQR
jgi:hypothetical protein